MNTTMALRLDPTTLLFSIAILGFATAGFAYSSARAMGLHRASLLHWSKAMWSVGAAFLLVYFRGHAPELLSYLLANALILVVPVQGLLAHASFFGRPAPRRTMAVLAAVGFSGVLAVYFFEQPVGLAVFTMSSVICTMFLLMGAMILRHEGWRPRAPSGFALVMMGLLAAVCATRAGFSLLGAGASVSMVNNSDHLVVVLVCGILFVVGASTGFVMMVHDRHRRDELESSRRDGLTGLLSRAAFFEAAQGIQRRFNEPHALVVVDIDHFKAINDNHGHSGGDLVLAGLGRLITGSIRSQDIAGRFGGDELCILLRHCGQAQARAFTERLILEAGQQAIALPQGKALHYTVSAGYAVRQASGDAAAAEAPEQLFERADAALYQAKRGNRNRAVAAGSAAPSLGGTKTATTPGLLQARSESVESG